MSNKTTTISLIEYSGSISKPFKNIINSINNYLLRNKGAVSDFNLIKDIVDRNIDSEEDAISSNLPIPLYLGLIGTMAGIIVGLMSMPSLSDATSNAVEIASNTMESIQANNIVPSNSSTSNSDAADNTMKGVDALLGGVKIAMFASVIGLFFTTINSFMFYYIRQKTEREKNHFFTFIQTRLLPILSKNTASSLQTLQANLLKFNEGFSNNMTRFDGVINEVRSSFQSQLQVVEELKRIDVSNMAKYNINVMKQIESSFSKLKELSEYLSNVNGLIKNTQQLNFTVSQQLDKVGQIATVVDNFDLNAKNIADGSKYLQTHFSDFERREQTFSNKMADFDSSTGEMVDALKRSFEGRMKAFNEMDVKINSSFEETLANNISGFEEIFRDLRTKTNQIFDDESQNIASIKKDVLKVNEGVNLMKSIPGEVGSLKSTVKEQEKTIQLMLEKIADKPLKFEMPTLLVILLILVSLIIMGTCGLFIYKYIL